LQLAGKALDLLAQLALHLEAGMPRQTLLDTLWPEQCGTQATVSLNSLVYNLQRRLRLTSREATPVIYANGSYHLNRDGGYTTDIARFDELISTGNRQAATDEHTAACLSFERAVALYRGDLSTGTDVYAVIERERLRANFLWGLVWLANHAYCSGDYAASLQHALRLLSIDPCREDAHRVIMRTHLRRGERAQALRQYRLCEYVLRREFDTAPEPQTIALYERIRIDPTSVSGQASPNGEGGSR
jgi:DNA-binding SARP family transcriptional activator